MCVVMQVLQEHRKVFEYNIAIIRGFHVGYRRYISALQKLVPTWLYLAGIVIIVTAWIVWYCNSGFR